MDANPLDRLKSVGMENTSAMVPTTISFLRNVAIS